MEMIQNLTIEVKNNGEKINYLLQQRHHGNECQPGYWNFPICQPCQCNGHASTCDNETGTCINFKATDLDTISRGEYYRATVSKNDKFTVTFKNMVTK